MPADWKEFEEKVWVIYDTLLNLNDEGTIVARDVKLRGRDGQLHQFDVYYSFHRAGVVHSVAIECKNYGRPVDKDRVFAFKSKIDDVIGLRGIMIAAEGFQDGARTYAENNGIIVLAIDDLPGLGELLAKRIGSVALPDETTIGEPFWAIYELRDGKNTGIPLGGKIDETQVGYLFLSKASATRFLESRIDLGTGSYGVRGLPQRCLRTFIMTIDAFRGLPAIVQGLNIDGSVECLTYSRQLFIDEWYIGRLPISSEPLVKPGY
ncbi:restriction endonuclease [Methylobacterium sp. WL69]|uniref:restriction endonuclease n=1 Tax=Methylobacterium sp. WL69 TaxID=2603893 RepID=UPI0011C7274A|nr:restriction endonuclease [Methylobacterium sp. WL69]TXM72481.1 restriction endonuclease [Methylobacterium sp. WL69]